MRNKSILSIYSSIIGITILSIILSIIYLWFTDHYKLMFILPLSFLLMFSILIQKTKTLMFTRLSILITLIFYFFRLVVVPILFVLSDGTTFIPAFMLLYASEAIILTAYEMICITIVILANYKKLNVKESIESTNNHVFLKIKYQKLSVLKFIVIFLIMYIVIISILEPSVLRQTFSLMVGTPESWYTRAGYRQLGVEGEGLYGVFATLVGSIYWIIQGILPAILLIGIIKSKNKNHQIPLLILLLFLSLMIVTGTRIHSLEITLSILWISIIVFKKRLKKYIPYVLVVGVALAVSNLFQKSNMSFYNFENLSKIFSSYFGGIQNLAASIYASKHIDQMNISLIFPDIFLKIPYISSIFKNLYETNSNEIFNLFVGQGVSIGQILPAVGQGYVYFGFILAPIIPMIGVIISMHFEIKARKSTNIVYKNIYLIGAIMMARIAPSTNFMSGVQYLFYTYLTLLFAYIGIDLLSKIISKTSTKHLT